MTVDSLQPRLERYLWTQHVHAAVARRGCLPPPARRGKQGRTVRNTGGDDATTRGERGGGEVPRERKHGNRLQRRQAHSDAGGAWRSTPIDRQPNALLCFACQLCAWPGVS